MNLKRVAVLCSLLAAALYAVSIPASKLLLEVCGPTMLAGLMYLGAGLGVGIMMRLGRLRNPGRAEQYLGREDLPYTIAMVVLDIAAPVLLMRGVARTSSANVSLLNNLEIAATALVALAVFREKISARLWLAIGLVTAAGVLLGFESGGGLRLDRGSLYVLGACLCWGVENNCTRSISAKSAEQIVVIKGIFSGMGSTIIALCAGERFPAPFAIAAALLLGFVSYGLSIRFYIMAQKTLGAAKTSAFYSIAPFLGVGLSFLLLGERPRKQFYLALALMALGTAVMIRDTLGSERLAAEYQHTHAHRHGGRIHTHSHRHFMMGPLHVHLHAHGSSL